jgi:transcriptional regulator with XRE-family HTH domain
MRRRRLEFSEAFALVLQLQLHRETKKSSYQVLAGKAGLHQTYYIGKIESGSGNPSLDVTKGHTEVLRLRLSRLTRKIIQEKISGGTGRLG